MKPLGNKISSEFIDGAYHIARYIYNDKTNNGCYPYKRGHLYGITNAAGICHHFSQYAIALQLPEVYSYEGVRNLRRLFKDWPHHSGVTLYPIPGTATCPHPEEAYMGLKNLWDHRQRQYRLNLLEYIIHRCALTLNARNYLKVPVPPYAPLNFSTDDLLL